MLFFASMAFSSWVATSEAKFLLPQFLMGCVVLFVHGFWACSVGLPLMASLPIDILVTLSIVFLVIILLG